MKLRAVLKWTGASLCALIFVVWFASGWVEGTVTLGGTYSFVSVSRGCVVLLSIPRSNGAISDGWHFWCGLPSGGAGWIWRPRWEQSLTPPRPYLVRMPLGIPFALCVVPTAWLFYRDRRTARLARAGACPKCGYSLSGLPPGGACPECGKGAS